MHAKNWIVCFLLLGWLSPLANAQDCWLAVEGAGKKNGTSPENAYGARHAQRCWDQTSETGTMHVLEGDYSYQEETFWPLKITPLNDGPEDGKADKILKGIGPVKLIGPRPVPFSQATASQGGTWIELQRGAHHIQIENFRIAQVEFGVKGLEGGYHHLELRDLHFEDTRQNIVLSGPLSKEIQLQGITGIRYSKRHIRLGQGISQVQVLDSHADAQFLDGDFAVGFDVENPATDIEFRNSTSRRNLFSGSEYWNGDGFKAEEETKNIRWIGCEAYENADAGFDIKTQEAVLENIVARENSRNIRIWQHAVLKNIDASFSKNHGGEATEAGIWSQGPYDCHFCTLQNNGVQVSAENGGRGYGIRFFDSVLSRDTLREGETTRVEDGIRVEWIRTKI